MPSLASPSGPLSGQGRLLDDNIAHATSFTIRFSRLCDGADLDSSGSRINRDPIAYHTLYKSFEFMRVKAHDRAEPLLEEAVAEAMSMISRAIETFDQKDINKRALFGSYFDIYRISDVVVTPALARLFAEVAAPYLHSLGYAMCLTSSAGEVVLPKDLRLVELEKRIEKIEAKVGLADD